MKIALVHDWLDTWAGGEQVLTQLCAMYPDAPVFTLVDFFPPDYRARLKARDIRTSFLQRMPFARSSFRYYLPLFPRAVERFDVAGFDVVISSSHAVAKGTMTSADQLHICYCYSPMRYAWDLREQYLSQVGLRRGLGGRLARRILDRIAAWDRASSTRVTEFVAISQHIADRIARCYDRESHVIYPPVDVPDHVTPQPRRKDLYVTVSRLVPYKRIDAVVAAFRLLPDRELVVIGEGPERARVAAAAGPNVRMLGQLPDAQRNDFLGRASAFVFAADEDFGIAPIEAQAFGTPVIALGRGGVLESVRGLGANRPTGVFFDAQTPEAIAAAVRTFEANAARIDAGACRENARRFAAQRFRDEFSAFVTARYTGFKATSP